MSNIEFRTVCSTTSSMLHNTQVLAKRVYIILNKYVKETYILHYNLGGCGVTDRLEALNIVRKRC